METFSSGLHTDYYLHSFAPPQSANLNNSIKNYVLDACTQKNLSPPIHLFARIDLRRIALSNAPFSACFGSSELQNWRCLRTPKIQRRCFSPNSAELAPNRTGNKHDASHRKQGSGSLARRRRQLTFDTARRCPYTEHWRRAPVHGPLPSPLRAHSHIPPSRHPPSSPRQPRRHLPRAGKGRRHPPSRPSRSSPAAPPLPARTQSERSSEKSERIKPPSGTERNRPPSPGVCSVPWAGRRTSPHRDRDGAMTVP